MSDCQYPEYVKDGLKVKPYWRNYAIGDRAWRMDTDTWFECIKPCVRLEAEFSECWEPDRGQSPRELGYSVEPSSYWSPENWEEKRGRRAANG